ncbi:MAG: phytanoyl-CoA dioxygenase family protein [Microthrixaceae bacterium]
MMTERAQGFRRNLANTMIDPDQQAHLDEFGYVVIDLLTDSQVQELRVLADACFDLPEHGFQASNVAHNFAYRQAVQESVGPILSRYSTPALDNYRAVNAFAIHKFPGEDTGFLVHQDWNVVDEQKYRGINLWCPLVDTLDKNGGLVVLPRSHRKVEAVRCDPDFPSWYTAPGFQVRWDEMVPLDIRAGQAVIFDHALVHGSVPNTTDEVRVAVALVMAPVEAPLLHWHLADLDSDELEIMSIDDEFYCSFKAGVRPDYPVVGRSKFRPDGFDRDELLKRCAEDSV